MAKKQEPDMISAPEKKKRKERAKDSQLSFRTLPEVVQAAEKLAAKRKWSLSLLCDELLRDALIRELRKEGHDREAQALKELE